MEEVSKQLDVSKKEAVKIFGINIQVITDYNPKATYPARYDFTRDSVIVSVKYLENHTSKVREAIDFAVKHEYGHAKDARAYEAYGIFPFILSITRKSYITIESKRLFVQELDKRTKFISCFIDGILGYPVDKMLVDLNLRSPLGRGGKWLGKSLAKEMAHEEDSVRTKLEALLNLPWCMGRYDFGELTQKERLAIRKYYEDLTGDAWKTSRKLLQSLEFGNIERYVQVTQELFEKLFDLTVIPIQRLKIKLGRLPSFWKQDSYFIFEIY